MKKMPIQPAGAKRLIEEGTPGRKSIPANDRGTFRSSAKTMSLSMVVDC